MSIGAIAGLAGPAMGLVGEALKMGTELIKMGTQMAKSQSGNKQGSGDKKDGCSEKDKIAHQQMHNQNRVNFSESSSSSTNHVSISANVSSKAA